MVELNQFLELAGKINMNLKIKCCREASAVHLWDSICQNPNVESKATENGICAIQESMDESEHWGSILVFKAGVSPQEWGKTWSPVGKLMSPYSLYLSRLNDPFQFLSIENWESYIVFMKDKSKI